MFTKEKARKESRHRLARGEGRKSVYRDGFYEPLHMFMHLGEEFELGVFAQVAGFETDEDHPRVGPSGAAGGLDVLGVVRWHSARGHHVDALEVNSMADEVGGYYDVEPGLAGFILLAFDQVQSVAYVFGGLVARKDPVLNRS